MEGENTDSKGELSLSSLMQSDFAAATTVGGMLSRTTNSPSAGINSEMEYVVQKIAALARIPSSDNIESSMDSNANRLNDEIAIKYSGCGGNVE